MLSTADSYIYITASNISTTASNISMTDPSYFDDRL